jgi:hypothetical protein
VKKDASTAIKVQAHMAINFIINAQILVSKFSSFGVNQTTITTLLALEAVIIQEPVQNVNNQKDR